MKNIYFGGGCFWCIEAIFQRVQGIEKVESGYTAGSTDNPTYREVSSGTTQHAEVVKVSYDEQVIDLETLMKIFFTVHDPTTLNRQGADRGTQYRSIILYENNDEQEVIISFIKQLSEENIWPDPIVTQVEPLDVFYVAEGYHQNYYNQNSNKPYCEAVINPKLAKLRSSFSHLLK